MAKEVYWKLAMYILAIVAGIFLILWPSFAYGGIKFVVKNIVDSVSFGAPELSAEKPALPEQQSKEIQSLINGLQKIKDTPDQPCFVKLESFSPLGNVKIEMVYSPDKDETSVLVHGGATGSQVISSLSPTIKGIRPCVIDGQEISTPTSLSITYNKPFWSSNQNRLDYANKGPQDFDDHWLFTDVKGRFCFFTNKNEGLRARYFGGSSGEGELREC